MNQQQPPEPGGEFVEVEIPEPVLDDVAAFIYQLGAAERDPDAVAAAWRKLGEYAVDSATYYALCAHITLTLTQAFRNRIGIPEDAPLGLRFANFSGPTPEVTDVEQVPSSVAFVGRWFTAAGNNAVDTMLALWGSIPDDPDFEEAVSDGLAQLWSQLATALLAGSPS